MPRRPCMRRCALTRSDSSSTGSRKASSEPDRGSSRSNWLGELEDGLRAAIETADPIDPGVPPPASRGRGRSAAAPLRAARRQALSSGRRRRPSAVASRRPRGSRRLLGDAGVCATKVEDDELARFLEARGQLVRLGEEHAIATRSLRDRQGGAPRRVRLRRRDHARALPGPPRRRPTRCPAPP